MDSIKDKISNKQNIMIFRSKVFKILIDEKGYDYDSLFCRNHDNKKELIDDIINAAFLIKDLLKDSSAKRYRRFLYKQKWDDKH